MAVIALGTYRCQVRRAAIMAAEAGARVIDTAPVYGDGSAEADLAPVLAAHPDLIVSTKAGHMTARQAEKAHRASVITAAEADARHSIAPAYIDYQIALSTRALGRVPDLVYLHNPDHGHTERGGLHDRLTAAFSTLETAVRDGRIRAYGVATWHGFAHGAFSVSELVGMAMAAGGDRHHLTAIQLPISLINLEPIAQALDGVGPAAEAHRAGLNVWASAPLHGGELLGMVNTALADTIRPGLAPAAAALLVTCSTPHLRGVLLSTSSRAHWDQATAVAAMPPLTAEDLRRICRVLTA